MAVQTLAPQHLSLHRGQRANCTQNRWVQTLAPQHLSLHSPEDVHEVFRQLGYDVYGPEPFEGDDLDELELEAADVLV